MPGRNSQYIKKTSIPGLLVIERPTHRDFRGFFHEIFRQNELEKVAGIKFNPVQLNHAVSVSRVIRAIHTEGWNKLVYPATGKMFAAIVDVRPESKTFGRVETFTFDNTRKDSPHKALFLPKGMGNSVCVIGKEPVHYFYIVDEYWDDKKAAGIAWDDPDLAIDWPVKNPIISERDKNNLTLREHFPEKFVGKSEKVLVFGGSGLVGSRFVELAKANNIILAPRQNSVDILKVSSLEKYFKKNKDKFDSVINFAAFTNVFEADKQRSKKSALSWKLNVQSAENVARVCKKYNKFLIHISTDFVFYDTDKDPGPFREDRDLSKNSDKLSWYGWTKLQGELSVREINSRSAIVRIVYPFRAAKYNLKSDFARIIVDLFKEKKLYPLFTDQIITPLFIDDIVEPLIKLLNIRKSGIYHVASSDSCSYYEFGEYLLEKIYGKHDLPEKGSLIEFLKSPGRNKRPVRGGLSTLKSQKELGLKFRSWKQMVEEFVDQLNTPRNN